MANLYLEGSTSLHVLLPSGSYQEPDLLRLEELIEYSARLLPAEGPIGQFVFQNPLHALEYLPFEEGVKVGNQVFGGEPYLAEEKYRTAVAKGRIKIVDLRSVLEEEEGAWSSVEDLVSRLDLRMEILLHPLRTGSTAEIEFYMAESNTLGEFLPTTSLAARKLIVTDVKRWAVRDLINVNSNSKGYAKPGASDVRRKHVLWPLMSELTPIMYGEDLHRGIEQEDSVWDSFSLKALWEVCCHGVRIADSSSQLIAVTKERPRDALLRVTSVDSDALVNELLIRFCAAFTDQGMSSWPLPDRNLGFFRSFFRMYTQPKGPPDRWLCGLQQELMRIEDAGFGPMDSILESLELLGIDREEWDTFLPQTLLALRGWASMIRQMEVRADRVPYPVQRGTMIEYMAVRLILERFALKHVAKLELSYRGPLAELREFTQQFDASSERSIVSRAMLVFQIAQSRGWKPSLLYSFDPERWTSLLNEIESFDGLERRRIFHKAYERRLRVQALDVLTHRLCAPPRKPEAPKFQIACCIDAREESFRRHLEEVCPDVETFGAPGFYGVPIYYRGAADAHPTAQCPIIIRPQHWVSEEPVFPLTRSHHVRARLRRMLGTVSHQMHVGSRSAAIGALVTGILGMLATFRLVLRILYPSLAARFSRTAETLVAPPSITRLVLERTAPAPGPEEGAIGFNLEEMVNISERLLRDIGLTTGFSRLVIFFGHGSHSLNNPHLSAYHCGACSGSPGGANARALAAMLNDQRVRAGLANRGLNIPPETVFIGALHNTSEETVQYFDLDLLPRFQHANLQFAQEAIATALERNAREKCRRFNSAPLTITPSEAKAHLNNRVEDLAQTRAEYGNASNAMCIVGRRERIRGLFLDRRSFLQSYDPTQDSPEGAILARVLGAVIPVCQGINLEYYFSTVDPKGLGAGSKLPHNVVGLIGVMNGMSSDLQQGLPAQGVEIHEPVRLLFVIETYPEVMQLIMQKNPVIDRIVRNEWAQVVVLHPETSELRVFQNGEFNVYHPSDTPLHKAASSNDWYSGYRDHLAFADITPATV